MVEIFASFIEGGCVSLIKKLKNRLPRLTASAVRLAMTKRKKSLRSSQ